LKAGLDCVEMKTYLPEKSSFLYIFYQLGLLSLTFQISNVFYPEKGHSQTPDFAICPPAIIKLTVHSSGKK